MKDQEKEKEVEKETENEKNEKEEKIIRMQRRVGVKSCGWRCGSTISCGTFQERKKSSSGEIFRYF